jgi:hypothetical protein
VDSRRERRKQFLIGLALTCFLTYALVVPLALLPPALRFPSALLVYTLNQFSGSSVSSLLDAIVVSLVPASAYGKLRLWCSVGYGSSAGLVGIAMILIGGEKTPAGKATDESPGGQNNTGIVCPNATHGNFSESFGVSGNFSEFCNVTSVDWMPYVTHFVPGLLCSLVVVGLALLLEDKGRDPELVVVEEEEGAGGGREGRDTSIQGLMKEEGEEMSERDVGGDDEDSSSSSPFSSSSSSSGLSLDDPSSPSSLSTYEEPESFLSKLRRVPWSFDLALFIAILLSCGSFLGLISNFLFLFIEGTLHGSQLIMGLCVLVNCVAEVPVFFFSEKLLTRVSADWALCLSLASYVLRFSLYSLFTSLRPPAPFILIPEALHGIAFALLWCATIQKITEISEKFNLVNFGVGSASALLSGGMATGALLSGTLLGKVPILVLWMIGTGVSGVLFILWGFYSWYNSRNNKNARR